VETECPDNLVVGVCRNGNCDNQRQKGDKMDKNRVKNLL